MYIYVNWNFQLKGISDIIYRTNIPRFCLMNIFSLVVFFAKRTYFRQGSSREFRLRQALRILSTYICTHTRTPPPVEIPISLFPYEILNIACRCDRTDSPSRNVRAIVLFQCYRMMFNAWFTWYPDLIHFRTMPVTHKTDTCPSAILFAGIILRIMKEVDGDWEIER